jgi:hypothetical protein
VSKEYLISDACGNLKRHEMCGGYYTYPAKPLPPLLTQMDPLIPKTMAAITFERSATMTAASRPNHGLRMMCRCDCHLEKLLAERDRLAMLRGAVEVGMPSETD